MNYYSYLLYSGSGKMQKTYIGATTDPDRRLEQHNRERAGGARATKGREWVRAVYVGGFPDWVSALQFEWAWKRHSRGKYGLEGKLKGLLGLLNTERSTKTALPFSVWPSKVFLQFNVKMTCFLEKIEAYNHLLSFCAPNFLQRIRTFPIIDMSSLSNNTVVDAAQLLNLSVQIQELKATQDELMKKLAEMTALVSANPLVVEKEKKKRAPRAKKDVVDEATNSDVPPSDKEKEKKKRGPKAKKVEGEPTGDQTKPVEGESSGEQATETAPSKEKKRVPKVKAVVTENVVTTGDVPQTNEAVGADSEKEKEKKKRVPKVKKVDAPEAVPVQVPVTEVVAPVATD